MADMSIISSHSTGLQYYNVTQQGLYIIPLLPLRQNTLTEYDYIGRCTVE